MPDHALQRTRHDAVVCNRCVSCAGSLSLGRQAARTHHIYEKYTASISARVAARMRKPSCEPAFGILGGFVFIKILTRRFPMARA